MCEALNSAPKESEIPVDTEDLPKEIQVLLGLYDVLLDNWDYVNGNYYGKKMEGITEVFDLYSVPTEDRLYYLKILMAINSAKVSLWHKKQKSKSKK